MMMARPPAEGSGPQTSRPPTGREERPTVPAGGSKPAVPVRRWSGGIGSWWWTAVCGAVAALAGLAAAVGGVGHAAAAVVVGSAVVAAPARPRRIEAVAAVAAMAGIGAAALTERPAALAGVAVASAAAQLALSRRGRPRAVATGLLVATVAGALALRAAAPESVGGLVDGVPGGVLILAALAVALFALPIHGGAATAPTAAVACAVLAVSVLGVTEAGTGVAAASLLAAAALALDRRPAAAFVAAAVGATATAAVIAGPLALVAAAVAAAVAVPGAKDPTPPADPADEAGAQERASRRGEAAAPDGGARGDPAFAVGDDDEDEDDDEDGDAEHGVDAEENGSRDDDDEHEARDSGEGHAVVPPGGAGAADVEESHPAPPIPVWATALAALPAGAAALDVAAARTPSAALVVAALGAAWGIPTLLDRPVPDQPAPARSLSPGGWPAAALAVVALVVPGRVSWVGEPLPSWSAGVGFAAAGAAVVIATTRRRERLAGPPPKPPPAWGVSGSGAAQKARTGDESSPTAPDAEDDEVAAAELGPGPSHPDKAGVAAPPTAEPVRVRRSAMTAGADEEPSPRSRRNRRR